MGINPRSIHHEDSRGNTLRIAPVDGKVIIGVAGFNVGTAQAIRPMSPIRLIGMIQEAAGLESSDPDSWTYRTQAFEWAMEQSGGDVASALQIARFIADGDEAVR